MGNMIVDGRRFVAASGTGESSDPYLPATTDYLDSQIYTVTFTVDTSALADGDLAANPVEIASAVRAAGGVSVATKVLDNPLPLKAAADSTSLWVSLVSNGTPTYGAASDVIATFTFARS